MKVVVVECKQKGLGCVIDVEGCGFQEYGISLGIELTAQEIKDIYEALISFEQHGQ